MDVFLFFLSSFIVFLSSYANAGLVIGRGNQFCPENPDHNKNLYSQCMFEAFEQNLAFGLYISDPKEFYTENCRQWQEFKPCFEKDGGFCPGQDKTGPSVVRLFNQLCSNYDDAYLYFQFLQRMQKLSTDEERAVDDEMQKCSVERGMSKEDIGNCYTSKFSCDQRIVDAAYFCALTSMAEGLPLDVDVLDKLIQKYMEAYGYKKSILVDYKNHCSLRTRRNKVKIQTCHLQIANELGKSMKMITTAENLSVVGTDLCRLLSKFDACIEKEGNLEETRKDCKVYDRVSMGLISFSHYLCSHKQDLDTFLNIMKRRLDSKDHGECEEIYLEDGRRCSEGTGHCNERAMKQIDESFKCLGNSLKFETEELNRAAARLLQIYLNSFGFQFDEMN